MGRRKFFIFHCFIAVLFCGILQGNAAQPRATEILERLAAGFRAMDGYGVKFGVVSGDYEARGSYVVEGDSYYLVLGDAEVYCDGAVRYEVDNRRREVTIDVVDTGSRNITLANLASPELVTDEAFHLIVCALLLAKYGDAILNFERR